MSQASLDDFDEAIANIKQRRGVVVFAQGADYVSNRYEITSVDTTADTVGVEADLSGSLSAGDSVPITNAPTGTTPKNGTYTVSSVSYASPETTVTFNESLEDSTVEGNLIDPNFGLNTAGIIKDTNIEGESNEFGPDNQGRTFTKGFDITGMFTAMQTGPPELQNLPALAEPSGNGLYIAFVDNPFPIADETAGMMYSDVAPLDKVELLNASVSPSFTLDFSREESEISNEVKGYISVDELEKIYNSPILMG